jgi:hypothetical protein
MTDLTEALAARSRINGDSRWEWATVTQVSPLRIRLDGQASALPITPEDDVGGLAVDDRVRVHFHFGRAYVAFRAGGLILPAMTSLATASTLALRDGSGRLRVGTPSNSADAATKAYVDSGDALKGESVQLVNASTGVVSAHTAIAAATTIPTAAYARVVELRAEVNLSAISAGMVWEMRLTYDGTDSTANILCKVRFAYNATATILDGKHLCASFDLPGAGSVTPRLWVHEVVNGGSITINDGQFLIRVRPKG